LEETTTTLILATYTSVLGCFLMREDVLYQDIRNWDGKRVAALFIYAFALLLSCQRVYVAIQAPRVERERRELTESFMEALIPEPSPGNIEK